MVMNVALRPVVDADLEEFFAQAQDPEATRRAQFPARDHEAFMTHWRTRILADPTVLVRTATVDGANAGTQFLQLEPIRPLYADPFAGNVASVRLLERCGFEREGTVQYGANEHILLVLGPPEAG
jgi:RimJ/RimL family protein N-acetyltransferase